MCRLILTNHADYNKYDRIYGIPVLMDHLEKQCGGHGNGYALIRNGKIFASNKGVKLTNAAIYSAIQPLEWDYLIWHTRIKSSGVAKNDASCHPFIRDNDCIAMNGTEWQLETIAQALNIIDTQVVFKMLQGLTLKKTVECLSQLDSVFIGTVDGRPYAVNAGGSLQRWGKSTFHASTFPKNVQTAVATDTSYVWADGKQLSLKIKKPTTDMFYGSSSSYHRYDETDYLYQEAFEEGYEQGLHDGQQEGYNQAIEEYLLDR